MGALFLMWLLLSIITALLTSIQDILVKKAAGRISPYVIAWGWAFFSLPFLAVCLPGEPAAGLGAPFWLALAVATVTVSVGVVFLFKAIAVSDLSLSLPILSFTPLFLLLLSPLLLKEYPSVWGAGGTLMVVMGSYVLFYHPDQDHFFAPFVRMLKSPGSKYLLLTAFIFSIGANMDKIGVRHSSPLIWSFFLNAACACVLTCVMLIKVKGFTEQIKSGWRWLFLVGLAVALIMIVQMHAIRLAQVPYVIAIKRTSVLFSSLWGLFWLKEESGWQRLAGIILMLSGVFVIALIG